MDAVRESWLDAQVDELQAQGWNATRSHAEVIVGEATLLPDGFEYDAGACCDLQSSLLMAQLFADVESGSLLLVATSDTEQNALTALDTQLKRTADRLREIAMKAVADAERLDTIRKGMRRD